MDKPVTLDRHTAEGVVITVQETLERLVSENEQQARRIEKLLKIKEVAERYVRTSFSSDRYALKELLEHE